MTVSSMELGLGRPLGRQRLARGTEVLAQREALHQDGGIITGVATGLKFGHAALKQRDGLGQGNGRHLSGRDAASFGSRNVAGSNTRPGPGDGCLSSGRPSTVLSPAALVRLAIHESWQEGVPVTQ